MTKDEAIQAMKDGKKVAHRHFSDDEWMIMENGLIVFEDGVKCSVEEFFKYRQDIGFQDGYSLV